MAEVTITLTGALLESLPPNARKQLIVYELFKALEQMEPRYG